MAEQGASSSGEDKALKGKDLRLFNLRPYQVMPAGSSNLCAYSFPPQKPNLVLVHSQ